MKDETGESILHWAALNGDVTAAKWLLEIGVERDAQADNLQTPLFWACTRGNLDMVLLLLSKDENGRSLQPVRDTSDIFWFANKVYM